ncbi:MAG: response regulator [Anaerolineae bacterium]
MAQHRQILIVDDDPVVLLILRATLERMANGYLIVATSNGAEALAEIDDTPFDLVVTDVRMPGIDGIELVEEIRARKIDTPVIWITAHGCYNLQAESARLDVYRCLDKPLRIEKIREAARQAMGLIPAPEEKDG